MRLMHTAVKALCLCLALSVSAAIGQSRHAGTAFLVDTSIPFASGGREHLVPVRGPYAMPTFQQGFVDGMHYRIYPDGGGLFGRDPRLRHDVFEVECEGRANTCIAKKGIVRFSIDIEGRVSVALDEQYMSDNLYLGYGDYDAENMKANWKKLNISIEMVSIDHLAEYSQMVASRGGNRVQQISLEGVSVIEAYLKWVWAGQPEKTLPVSWEDAHIRTEDDVPQPVKIKLQPDGIIFENGLDNDWALYSPLVQFQPEEPVVANNAGVKPAALNDQALPQYNIEPRSLIGFTGTNSNQNIPDAMVNLAELDSDVLLNFQTRPDDVARRTFNSFQIDEAMLSDRSSTSAVQSKVKLRQKEILQTGNLFSPDIGGNICKPAILLSNSENHSISKSVRKIISQLNLKPGNEFAKPGDALKDLPGIYVFTDYLAEPAHLKGQFNGRVHDAIEARLKAVGIGVLTKSAFEKTPGQPRMEVYFSKANIETGCSFAVWISVRQSMLLGRDRNIRLLSGTWGSGGSHLQKYKDAPEFNTIMDHVERFIADYSKANS